MFGFFKQKKAVRARQPRLETLLAYSDVIAGTMPGDKNSVYERVLDDAAEKTNNEGLKFDYEIYYLAYGLFAQIPEHWRSKHTAEQTLKYLEEKAQTTTPADEWHRILNRLFPERQAN